jgi:protein-L-isoaspartate(D-aspartate) O-methyltransferase
MSIQRAQLVQDVHDNGVESKEVLESINTVPRHEFVPGPFRAMSYENTPLPIGEGQTISQPQVVASMAELAEIKKSDVVLEVGSGCGYNAAVLSRLAYKVYSTEIIQELAKTARRNLEKVGYDNVVVMESDGGEGYAEEAPYDVIMVTCSAPSIPAALKEQLAVGGRMVIPVHYPLLGYDKLTKVTRVSEGEYREEQEGDVQFVPLTGAYGHTAASIAAH